jgi:ubiquinone/menaquinone biosynthesis C-methylase UbiE
MGLYQEYVLPHVINLAMRNRENLPYRQRVISASAGRVLEIGIGSGLNLPFYPAAVDEIIGLEPSPKLVEMTRRAARDTALHVSLIEGSAEAIPLDSASIDTVVTTWTLCTIPGANQALEEVRRVLRPGGQLLFVEHGLAPEAEVRKWQNRLNPVWKVIGGGCNLNRPIRSLIENGGFKITGIETGYARGPRPMTFMYEGRALPG